MTRIYRYQGRELELFAKALRWKTYFRSILGPYINGNVMEVGAGNGNTTLVLTELSHLSWTCLEPDSELCSALSRTLLEAGHQEHIQIINGTTQSLPLEQKFDSIVYIDVLEHIKDDADELSQTARLLAPGGALMILAPAHQWLFSEFDAAIGHYRRYSKKTLRRIAPQGLSEEKLVYLDSVGLMASLANKLVLHRENPSAAQVDTWDRYFVPISRVVDPILFYQLGKTVVGIWKRLSD